MAQKRSKGFNYDALDAYKREAQEAAASTTVHLARHGFKEVKGTRGESSYLVDIGSAIIAFTIEGLGTKNKVAEDAIFKAHIANQLKKMPGASSFHLGFIAQDAVAMCVNDLATSGAAPVVVGQHIALGSAKWLKNKQDRQDFINGWVEACNLALSTWGPGETSVLKSLVGSSTAVIGGGTWGIIKPKSYLVRGNVQHGDAIILVEGNGVHANGLTKSREIAARLPQGYLTPLAGRTYGEALLDPTPIYSLLVEELNKAGVALHYVVNITGHGWRKLMRPNQPMSYEIEQVPEPQPLFHFIQGYARFSDKEMYGDYNMNAGYALCVSRTHEDLAVSVIRRTGHEAFVAGRVLKAKKKRVLIHRKGREDIIFNEGDLRIR